MTNEAVYQERFQRICNAIHCEPVDRVPVIYMATAFSPRFMGMKMSQFVTDLEAASWVALQTMEKIGGFDGCMMTGGGGGLMLAGLWLSHVRLPGQELPDDVLWQIAEAEVMTQADYDAIIQQGWQPWLMSYLPRVVDMAQFGAQAGWSAMNGARIHQGYNDAGYVAVADAPAMLTIPYEYLCGGRSMQQFIFDLHRIPDKVEAAMKVVHEANLATIAALPQMPPTIIGGSWIGGWRSASAMLSPKLWNRFVWPYIVEMADALMAKGVTPILHWDQDWTRDLVRLQELPAKKVCLNPDGMTDVRKFKELVGDNMAMMGDVPAALFAAGTPDDVYKYVRELVRDLGTTGLLLCPGCDAPINTKPENMEAFVAAAREFGKVA